MELGNIEPAQKMLEMEAPDELCDLAKNRLREIVVRGAQGQGEDG
jgi:hypothetical protein